MRCCIITRHRRAIEMTSNMIISLSPVRQSIIAYIAMIKEYDLHTHHKFHCATQAQILVEAGRIEFHICWQNPWLSRGSLLLLQAIRRPIRGKVGQETCLPGKK